MKEEKTLAVINKEITKELADPAVARALLSTTFKGLEETTMRKAILEGHLRGFTFKNFLSRDVYAIPFKDGYSLVTSIDFARKKAMRVGVVGKSAPQFTYTDGKEVESCTITVKRQVEGVVGEWTATVFMDEYYKAGRGGYPSLWDSKPRTMLAKVAESHALRMACPEELSQTYTEEEFDKEKGEEYDREGIDDETVPTVHVGDDHGASKPNLIIDRMSTQEAPEMPQTDEEKLNLIKGLFVKKWPDLGAGMPAITKKVKDYCGVPLTAENYEVVINMLR